MSSSTAMDIAAAASSSPSLPPLFPSQLNSLNSLEFRPAKARDGELPTKYLQACFEREEASQINITIDDVYATFAPFGEIEGMKVLPPPKQPPTGGKPPEGKSVLVRTFAFVAFALKQHAAHAMHALHQKRNPQLPLVKMHVHHAVIKEKKEDTSADSAASDSKYLPRPSGLSVHSSLVAPSLLSPVVDSMSYLGKGEVHYGAPRKTEDDFMGLRKPALIQPELYAEIIKQLQALDSNPSEASPINRLTLSVLQPGQGLKRTHESPIFSDRSFLVNLGPSHTVVEFHPAHSEKSKHLVLLNAGDALFIGGQARSDFEYAIPGKTRDVLPAEMVQHSDAAPAAASSSAAANPATPSSSSADTPNLQVNLKRGKTILLFARSLVNPDAEEAAATSDSSVKKSLKEKKNALDAEVGKEKKEKTVHSTAIRIPASSSTVSSSASSSTTASGADHAVETEAARLEQLHVQGVYDSIAEHFSNTRHSPWPRIEKFVENIEAGSLVGDIGCGNGKYMGLNKGITIRGCDSSPKLVEICKQRGYDVIVGDILSIPFDSNTLDAVICIAVLHHLSTDARRQKSVRELLRVAKKGAKILVSAWALEQDVTSRRSFPSQDVLVPWNVPRRFLPPGEAGTQAEKVAKATTEAQRRAAAAAATTGEEEDNEAADAAAVSTAVDPSSGSELVQFQRYCHVYKSGELEALFTDQFKEGTEVEIVDKYYDRGNWVVVARKLADLQLDGK